MRHLILIAVAGLLVLPGCSSLKPSAPATAAPRQALWVDGLRAEPVSFEVMLDDLGSARVVYLGEYHTLARHHELQDGILAALAERGVALVLAMEQFEFMAQPALDRFKEGQSDLAGLIEESDWPQRWRGHTNYHALMRTARAHGIPVLALNARAETIRAVGRQGLAGITPEQRAELPAEIVTEDPAHERLLNTVLGVHMAFDPARLRPVIEAQMARDEMMAARLVDFLNSPAGQGRIAVVICGRGHCEFGLGMPSRVALRLPGVSQRIVLFSHSGDLHLTEAERKQAREIEVPRALLHSLGAAPADYFHLIEPVEPSGK